MKPKSPHFFIILLMLAISGFTALGYQLCWIRVGSIQFGSTMSAMSTVIAAFFAGIAVGSYLFGKMSVGHNRLVLLYGILEIFIGCVACCTLLLLQWSDSPFGAIYQMVHTNGAALVIARSLLIFGIIMPTSILIGGVFPILCQLSTNLNLSQTKSGGAQMYAANTFGAVAGCLVCGLYLIPTVGITATNIVSCGVSVTLGISAILLRKKIARLSVQKESAHMHPVPTGVKSSDVLDAKSDFPKAIMYLLFALSGYVALGIEVLWTRFLSLVIHTTAYTYVFSLATILLGIAIGSLLISYLHDRFPAPILFGIVNILIGISISMILLRPLTTWNWIYDSKDLIRQAVFCGAIFLAPSILMGASFPLAMAMVRSDTKKYGRNIGSLLSANTLGGIAGAILVGFVFLPLAGMHRTLILLTNISIVIGSIVILLGSRPSIKIRIALCGSGFTVWLLVWVFGGVRLPDDFLGRDARLIEVREGVASFLSVIKRKKEISLEIDGMWQGQKSKDYQIMAAHIPMMLHPNPASVLVVGVGTGQTARRFLMYPIQRLDCADIERDLPELIVKHFDGGWLSDPRVRYIAEDGRTVVLYSKHTYDIVSIEAGQTFRSQAATLYTADFYRHVKSRLNSNGLACQFVPIGFFSAQEFASVVRTFIEVFPHSTLWFNKYAELILIGSPDSQPVLTGKRLTLLDSDTAIHNDLSYSFHGDHTQQFNRREIFAANYLMGTTGLAAIANGGSVYRDQRPQLAYRTATMPYSPSRFSVVIQKYLEDPAQVLEPSLRACIDSQTVKIRLENVRLALSE